ncbi:MAG TPA: SpoIIE family protein phosphatase [Candidatus Deferrimicrobium sp.]|nr:SpoIIE family protein phosphatase [Candidatus Kapabacteria bacterium]HLP62767.1 SpoIIE family protein phosphatase [Candidatus Deferrimicrobium sp.]
MPQTDHQKELNGLIKAIRIAPGFSLLVASFNNDNYRDTLIEKINSIFPKNTILEMKNNGFAEFTDFEDHMASLSNKFTLIHVVNKGDRLYKDTWPVFYKGINYHREKIARENQVNIILWMRPEDVKDFALTAPDMWHWRSGVFDFELTEPQFQTQENEDEIIRKKTRIGTIISYLNDNPDTDDSLRASLNKELGELSYALGDYKKAEEYILEALDFYIKKGEAAKQESLYGLLDSIKKISAVPPSPFQKVAESILLKRELSLAALVQQNMLPNKFPPFPQHREFHIFAKMVPAGMIGRAFYDYFILDAEKLAFAVGCVQGKGIPAALYMVKAHTLFKMNALKYSDPGACLTALNNDFVDTRWENISKHEFFNLFYGVLNIKTGEVNYCCAGNPFPLVIWANGEVEPIPQVQGINLGVSKNFVYEVGKIQLAKKDIIFAFTDSVINTRNSSGELFDLDMYLENRNNMALKEIIEGLLGGITLFTEGAPQSDDIAMLALRFN